MTPKSDSKQNNAAARKSAKLAPAATPEQKRSTKAEAVLALLNRESGATLAQLVEVTGWLPHTARAALTGLRKRGHDVTRSKEGDVSIYRVAS